MIVNNFVNKTLVLLFPLFAFLLPLQTRWIVRDAPVGYSVWEYGRVSVYGLDIVLILMNVLILIVILAPYRGTGQAPAGIQKEQQKENDFCLFLFSGSRNKFGMTVKHLFIMLFAGVFVAYEMVVSLDPVLTAVVLARLALIALAGWYVLTLDSIVVRRTLAAFVVSMVLSAGLGAAQFFTQSSMLGTKWLGLHWHDASVLGTSVVEAAGGRWLRAHGTMPHPNALGGFSALGLMVFLSLVSILRSAVGDAHARPDRRVAYMRPLQNVLGFSRNIFVAVAPLILLAGVVTAASRAAIIATVAGGVALAWQARRDIRYKTLVPWIRGMAIAWLLIVLLAGPVAFTRLTAHGRLEALSFTRRAAAFKEAFATVRLYGGQGTGLGAATVALRELYPRVPIWEIQPVHNLPILLFVELGLWGTILVVLVILLVRQFPISNFQFPNKPQYQISNYRTVLPLLVCWFVLILLDHYLWTLPAGLYVSVMVWWAGRGA